MGFPKNHDTNEYLVPLVIGVTRCIVQEGNIMIVPCVGLMTLSLK